MLLAPILLLKLYQGILYPALSVEPGNSEAYSVIIQQFGCVYNDCELDMEEKICFSPLWMMYHGKNMNPINRMC